MVSSEVLFEKFGVRKSGKQKKEFRDWLVDWLGERGYTATVEHSFLGNNVVVGNPETASVILGAHYDTPATLFFPNFSTPWSKWKGLLYMLPVAFVFSVFLLVVVILSYFLFGDNQWLANLVYFGVLFLLIYLMLCGPANKSNVNDNTSGVLTLMNIADQLSENARGKVCFVFFDNEEKGLLGSLAFYTKSGAGRKDKLLLNFDCVSDGDYLSAFPSMSLLKNEQELLSCLSDVFPVVEGKTFAMGQGSLTSDNKVFKRSIGFCALKQHKFWGGYLDKIHTRKDTVLDARNIDLFSEGVLRFIDILEVSSDAGKREV